MARLRIDDSNRKWWILISMGSVLGITLLDETIVGVALPTIQREFGISIIASHWVVNAYLLVFAGLVAAGGKLGDIFGLRNVNLLGLAIFGLSSLAAGFSPNGEWLIGARAVQGIGAAIIFPGCFAMTAVVFPEEERGFAIGIQGAIGTIFLALGPFLGGLFTELVSWRWIFWINPFIAFCAACVVLAAWRDPEGQGPRATLDVPGLVTMILGLSLVVYAAMEGPDIGWTHWSILGGFIVGVALLVIFVVLELRIKLPLIEVDLFQDMNFTACNLVCFMAQYTKIVLIVFGALFFQESLGMSPIIAGIALAVAILPEPFIAIPAGKYTDRVGSRKPAIFGLIITFIAMLWFGLAAPFEYYLAIVPALLLWGIGQPFIFVPSIRGVMNTLPLEKQGQANGVMITSQMVGGTFGMTVCGLTFALTDSYGAVFMTAAGMAFLTLIVGFLWIKGPDGT